MRMLKLLFRLGKHRETLKRSDREVSGDIRRSDIPLSEWLGSGLQNRVHRFESGRGFYVESWQRGLLRKFAKLVTRKSPEVRIL